MLRREVISGASLTVLGAATVGKAQADLDFGTVGNMGPGFFPVVLGWGLIICGLLIAGSEWLKGRPIEHAETGRVRLGSRQVLMVSTAVVLFALILQQTKALIPAAFVLVVVSALADRRTSYKLAVQLAILLSTLSWLIFVLGLGMPLHAFGT